MTHWIGDARRAAEKLQGALASSCERIEIAGSIRRRVDQVKDIELVAVPKIVSADAGDLWGSQAPRDLLAEQLQALRLSRFVVPRDVEVHRKDGSVEHSQRVGDRYQALEFEGIPVDLFVVRPPADWGVVFAIRTGPAEFSHQLVTDCQRFFRKVRDGQLLDAYQQPIPCPEEADFFRNIGQPWLDPWERRADRVRLSQPTRSAA